MVRWSLTDGNRTASIFGSYHGKRAAISRIHTAHHHWRRNLEKATQTLPVPPSLCGPQQPSGYPTCGQKKRKLNTSVKQWPLMIAAWNVRTLQVSGLGHWHHTALIACELARYNIDIAALSVTRLPEESSFVQVKTGYMFLWSGLPKDFSYIHGV